MPRLASAAIAVLAALAAAASATAATKLRIASAKCVPAEHCAPGKPRYVSPGGKLILTGTGLARGHLVNFPRRSNRKKVITSKLRKSHVGLVVVVPPAAGSGRIRVVDHSGRRSNAYGPMHVVKIPPPVAGPTPSGTVFDGNGMWIWYLDKSDNGDLDAIAARANAAGVKTVFIKSGDGATYWSQFSPLIVGGLKQRGLNVCAWQFVYGKVPTNEADVGAQAVQSGAQCLVVDAESDYEGKYQQAKTYMARLTSQLPPGFPIGLTSFPYVDYHPSLPYSVFFSNGVGFNLPQVYWKDIGTTVDTAMQHTYVHNKIYGKPIFPLGQSYNDPPPADMTRFRQLAAVYGSSGLSWWSWQASTDRGWQAVGAQIQPLTGYQPSQDWPLLKLGSKGDETLWMQEHLAAADPTTPVTGTFDTATDTALRNFQAQRGFPVTGSTDAATWQALLAMTPVAAKASTLRSAGTASRKREIPVLGRR
ncbi:MAG TPA: peptidoglycan-binding domain-containing protein [Thermoleophilaceae bacterium]|nr:peptidoglycan-binding domain-containing protein [Thermoleophilaceae bacterium]